VKNLLVMAMILTVIPSVFSLSITVPSGTIYPGENKTFLIDVFNDVNNNQFAVVNITYSSPNVVCNSGYIALSSFEHGSIPVLVSISSDSPLNLSLQCNGTITYTEVEPLPIPQGQPTFNGGGGVPSFTNPALNKNASYEAQKKIKDRLAEIYQNLADKYKQDVINLRKLYGLDNNTSTNRLEIITPNGQIVRMI